MNYPVLVIGGFCLALCACASPNAGNPNGDAYAGSPESVYDVAAHPPSTNGTVAYDPNAPLPPVVPPPPGPSVSGMTAPTPAAANRMPR
ncbi:MAG: hypothetical protein ACXWLT_10945 [Rhizomicrobium sp.]